MQAHRYRCSHYANCTLCACCIRFHTPFPISIEGLHYTVRSHTRIILPYSLVSFFYSAVWRKATKHVIILDSLHYRIPNFTLVCVLTQGCQLSCIESESHARGLYFSRSQAKDASRQACKTRIKESITFFFFFSLVTFLNLKPIHNLTDAYIIL